MTAAPVILFGAFDRHNFGDLLFPHLAEHRLAGRPVVCAGLVERDFTGLGGHRVEALGRLAAEWRERYGDAPADLIHVGGEILTVDAWQAAVMLSPPGEAGPLIARFADEPAAGLAWAQGQLGLDRVAAYVVPKRSFVRPGRFAWRAVGGVDLDSVAPGLRDEVIATLHQADDVTVRDRRTLAHLEAAGIEARLEPDAVTAVATCCGERIRRHAEAGEPAAIRRACPRGYVAVQFAAEFGDDATLAALAAELDRVAGASGATPVFFRAGAAPWHDDLDCLRRAAARVTAAGALVFGSLDIWDIAALIAGARGGCGTSLHGRIVADACGVPAVSLAVDPARGQGAKLAAWLETWASDGTASLCPPAAFAAPLLQRMNEDARPATPR